MTDGARERVLVDVPAGEEAHIFAGDILGPSRTSLVTERIVDFIRRRVAPPRAPGDANR